MATNALASSTTATAYVIPLQDENQDFDISLNGTTYHFIVKWNDFSNCWELYIEDSMQNSILSGVPLVTGCDLLEQYEYLGIGGALVVQSTNNPDLVPSYSTLGSTGNLFFIVPVTSD